MAADELRHRAKEAEQNAGHWNSGTEGHAWRLRQAAEFRALAELVDASQTANTYEWPDTRALLDARQRVTDALAAVEAAFGGEK